MPAICELWLGELDWVLVNEPFRDGRFLRKDDRITLIVFQSEAKSRVTLAIRPLNSIHICPYICLCGIGLVCSLCSRCNAPLIFDAYVNPSLACWRIKKIDFKINLLAVSDALEDLQSLLRHIRRDSHLVTSSAPSILWKEN